jgi:type I restriction enzyme S subunit
MLNMGELFAHGRIGDLDMVRVEMPKTKNERALLKRGDLIFARRSLSFAGAGKCSIVASMPEPTTWESSIIRARVDPRLADPAYLYYYFMSSIGRRQMETIIEQVAAAGIRISDLARLRVPLPSLAGQSAIAAVLGALDDKIAANSAAVTTSDSFARSLYGSLSTAELVPLSQLFTEKRIAALPSQVAGHAEHARYVGLEHIGRRRLWLSKSGLAGDVTSQKKGFEGNDVLFGKLRPYFHKVALAPFSGICSTDIIVLSARDPLTADLAAVAVADDEVVRAATASSEGTRMPRTSWKDLSGVAVPWPSRDTAIAANKTLAGLTSMVHALNYETVELEQLRDALLPPLMSGKLRVKDAERAVEDVL